MSQSKPTQENPLVNIFVNVLIPVLALSYLSKSPIQPASLADTVKPWHIGPLYALLIALIFPISYGIWHFWCTRKMNFFSSLGLVSVCITGGLTLFLWNADGSIKPHADWLFGIKEGSIPLMLGIAVIGSHFTSNPLIKTFLYHDAIFDVPKIEAKVAQLQARSTYQNILFNSTILFASSFFLSSILNVCVSLYFLADLNPQAENAQVIYNAKVAKITFWGMFIIGIPMLGFVFLTLKRLIKKLSSLTGLSEEEIMLPR